MPNHYFAGVPHPMQKPRWTETQVTRKAGPKTRYDYYVTGKGTFPFDMLRYDACWPASADDAAKLYPNAENPRSILMRSYKQPEIERWSSFGWPAGTEKLY
jgi:hypothetical protein